MTYQIYPVGYSPSPTRPPALCPGATRLPVAFAEDDSAPLIGSNAWKLMDFHHLAPSPRAVELYHLALLAYTADTRIPRKLAFNKWERDVCLCLPVVNPKPWLAVRELVMDLLSFLTGDHWNVEFFPSYRNRPLRDVKAWRRGAPPRTDSVALFSGGLDSFIGVSDLLASGTRPLLVGHCDSPLTSAMQTALAATLRSKYSAAKPLLQFWIKPPELVGREDTTRGRSFLFFALATLAAAGMPRPARLVVPENGFIALNAPLTSARLGALSTRTVHPYTVTRYRELLKALRLPVTLETPYALVTKGEMLEQGADQAFLRSSAAQSMSCAHPTAGRWQGLGPKHCGRCVPCLIRRASLHRVGLDKASDYVTDVLTVGRQTPNLQDVRAFLTAIERGNALAPEIAVLRSGPIPTEAGSLADYASLYSRGLAEVETFLRQRQTRRL